ncbi:hypothetical protein JCM10213v2_006839 [Rhodosporidiobolus nylandii]
MHSALLLVDIQHDFLPPSGALAVPQGDSILPGAVYRLLDEGKWDLVVASQDFHPPSHISFASRHRLPPFSSTSVALPSQRGGGEKEQELWPDHCVQGTWGCEFDEGVQERLRRIEEGGDGGKVEVVRKGTDIDLDAYSAFAVPLSSANQSESALTRLLLDSHITTLVVVGLATDFCVRATVLAALEAAAAAKVQWRVLVVREGVKGVYPEKEEATLSELREKGAEVVSIEGEELRPFLRGSH